mmetsp:Transcript_31281/g.74332  ORF Transcript_31281/g.74332 Transcript_31281/m.74332 type:complete len:626 (+) Transcript_31281:3935-5812(+)
MGGRAPRALRAPSKTSTARACASRARPTPTRRPLGPGTKRSASHALRTPRRSRGAAPSPPASPSRDTPGRTAPQGLRARAAHTRRPSGLTRVRCAARGSTRRRSRLSRRPRARRARATRGPERARRQRATALATSGTRAPTVDRAPGASRAPTSPSTAQRPAPSACPEPTPPRQRRLPSRRAQPARSTRPRRPLAPRRSPRASATRGIPATAGARAASAAAERTKKRLAWRRAPRVLRAPIPACTAPIHHRCAWCARTTLRPPWAPTTSQTAGAGTDSKDPAADRAPRARRAAGGARGSRTHARPSRTLALALPPSRAATAFLGTSASWACVSGALSTCGAPGRRCSPCAPTTPNHPSALRQSPPASAGEVTKANPAGFAPPARAELAPMGSWSSARQIHTRPRRRTGLRTAFAARGPGSIPRSARTALQGFTAHLTTSRWGAPTTRAARCARPTSKRARATLGTTATVGGSVPPARPATGATRGRATTARRTATRPSSPPRAPTARATTRTIRPMSRPISGRATPAPRGPTARGTPPKTPARRTQTPPWSHSPSQGARASRATTARRGGLVSSASQGPTRQRLVREIARSAPRGRTIPPQASARLRPPYALPARPTRSPRAGAR